MARARSVVVASFNIEMGLPHSPERYDQMWMRMFRLRRAVQTRGDQHMMIADAAYGRSRPHVIQGTIARFTRIDPEMPWFNDENLSKAEEKDRRAIVIPRNLNPNYKTAYYAFDTQQHKLYVEVYGQGVTVSTKQIEILLKKLAEDKSIVEQFDTVGVSVIQTGEAIEEVESLSYLKTLLIDYQQPNDDDHDRFDAVFANKMRAVNARSAVLSLEAGKDVGIIIDPPLRRLAVSALKHGKIIATGLNILGKFVRLSSQDHPETHTERYDPDLLTDRQAFNRVVRRLSDREGS